MFRFLLLCVCLVSTVGCQFNRSFATLSPNQIVGSERSRLGVAALERGNLADAEKHLEGAVRSNKNDINYRRQYAEVLWQQGKYQEALHQLDEALKRDGHDNASLHISLAEKYLAIQDHATAYRHANEAVRLSSQDYRSWALRGRAKRFRANHEAGYTEHTLALLHSAREDYLRAVSLAPYDRELLTELAITQMNCGQSEQALATWLSVRNLYSQGSEPAEVLVGKMETLAALRRFDEAEKKLLVLRQRGLESAEAEQQLQKIMTATQGDVRW